MKYLKLLIACFFLFTTTLQAQDSLALRRIYDEALINNDYDALIKLSKKNFRQQK